MSAHNGDKSRHHRLRKAKLARRRERFLARKKAAAEKESAGSKS